MNSRITSPEAESQRGHDLQCMEIWNGNRYVERDVTSAGLQAWVYSQPYQSNRQFGRELNRRLSEYSCEWLGEDDTTLIAIQFTKERRTPGLFEKLTGYLKVVRRAVISR